MKNKSIILYVICIILIIIGAIVVKVKGVNYSFEYQDGKNIEIYFENEIIKSDIEEIAKDVFGKDVIVYEVERYNDAFSLKVKDVTDEQKESLVSKINEKFSLEWTTDNLTITDIPRIAGFDFIKNYIKPTLISVIVIAVYMLFRYRRIEGVKVTLCSLLKIILVVGAFFGIVGITRLPIVNEYLIALGLLIATVTLLITNYKNELALDKYNESKKNEKK